MKNNLRKIRLNKGISQIELSNNIGISNQMISDYENNRYNMSIKKLIKLADYFNVSLDYLIGRNYKQKR